ncbi:hypothetical protein QJS10_CPA07g01026 [Acorus calamus]|uniref:Alkaline phytoceramidase n=1 Tax=Acorus calamus TaxID=4465 RepID=A0AAV9EID5_ACOCL|nr:hypothetical protein QJS10_CPA07g01026 [Acorus calamus]
MELFFPANDETHHKRIFRGNRLHICVGAFLVWPSFMLVTPRIPHSPSLHVFADMRNFLGVPNTLNVISNFPFLVVGVVGLVLCLHGNCFGISLKWEVWGWAFFYMGITAVAFGSSYYHLKPDDSRLLWDRLPMMIAITSLFSSFVIERMDERIGVTCLFSLHLVVLFSILYERIFDDLRVYLMFHIIPCVAIPMMAFMLPPKYTHSRFWFWASGFYVLAKFEACIDKKMYQINHYTISGHSLEHLFLAMVPVILTMMLWFRNIRIARDS